jgi:hypothetical protein
LDEEQVVRRRTMIKFSRAAEVSMI